MWNSPRWSEDGVVLVAMFHVEQPDGLEQGLLCGNAVPAGEPLGAGLPLVEHLVTEPSLTNSPGSRPTWATPSAGQRSRWPSSLGGSRRLRDDEPPTLAQERGGALGHHGRGTEGPHHHPVERPPVLRIPPAHFGPLVDHGDPLLQAAAPHRPPEELGAALVGVQQHQAGRGPADRPSPARAARRPSPGRGCGAAPVPDGTAWRRARSRIRRRGARWGSIGPGPRKPARASVERGRRPGQRGRATAWSVSGTDGPGQPAGAMTM